MGDDRDRDDELRGRLADLEQENRELRALLSGERAIFEREQRRVRGILERITDAFVALDNDWRYVYVNEKAGAMFGRDAGSLIGKHIWTEFPEGRGQPFHRAYERAIREQVPVKLEEYYPPWKRWFENRIYPSPEGVSIFFEEITERKLAEEELRSASAEMQAVLDGMSETVIACDPTGRVTLANHAARALLGVAASRPSPRMLSELFEKLQLRTPDGRAVEPNDTAFARALHGGKGGVADLLIRAANGGDRLIRFSVCPLHARSGELTGALAVGRDVTEQIEFARMKDDFIAAAAHELQTPLAVIRASAQLVVERWSGRDASPVIEARLHSILRGVDRMHRIVSDLVQLTAAALGQIVFRAELVDLGALVLEVVAPHRAAGRVLFVHACPARVRADPVRLRYVLEALIDNAVKWSPIDRPIEVFVAETEDEATVRVVDRGVGIPRERQGRIFECFYRAHAGTAHDVGGMGIGLHLSRRFLEQMGGSIDFESAEGEGSTFRFKLPRPLEATGA